MGGMDAGALFDKIKVDLADDGVEPGQLFGAQALTIRGKPFACLKDEHMAFKLGRDSSDLATALDLPGAALFDPSGQGRPFQDWVAVPVEECNEWEALAQQALRSVAAEDASA